MESSLGDVGGSTVVLFEIGRGHEKNAHLSKVMVPAKENTGGLPANFLVTKQGSRSCTATNSSC